jgi:uncharacterized protein with PQ loop repeat
MEINVPVIAGALSTLLFILSMLPMLWKAFRLKDLKSYSLGNILLSNLGNLIHSMYVFHLPPGPVWLLHTFYLVTMGLMLVWYLRYEWRPGLGRRVRVKETNEVSRKGWKARDRKPGGRRVTQRHCPRLFRAMEASVCV